MLCTHSKALICELCTKQLLPFNAKMRQIHGETVFLILSNTPEMNKKNTHFIQQEVVI
jgi:hypothetical protein